MTRQTPDSGARAALFCAAARAASFFRAQHRVGRALCDHTATLLAVGQVLVAGGQGSDYENSAEVYDPATTKWTFVGSMSDKRSNHTANLLASGQVLVAGGNNSGGFLRSAELYDPVARTWTVTGSLADTRSNIPRPCFT